MSQLRCKDVLWKPSYKTSKYKDAIYKSYFLAESYREGKKVKKRVIWPIGKLTDMQISQISMICKTMTDPDHVLTTLDKIYYVYRDAHVRAVYSICVLAYFLNKVG